MSDRHAPLVLARIWRVQLVVLIGLEGFAVKPPDLLVSGTVGVRS